MRPVRVEQSNVVPFPRLVESIQRPAAAHGVVPEVQAEFERIFAARDAGRMPVHVEHPLPTAGDRMLVGFLCGLGGALVGAAWWWATRESQITAQPQVESNPTVAIHEHHHHHHHRRDLVVQRAVPGPRGARGLKGEPGPRGHRGFDGRDGVDGRDGRNGKDGRDGRKGRDGVLKSSLPKDTRGAFRGLIT